MKPKGARSGVGRLLGHGYVPFFLCLNPTAGGRGGVARSFRQRGTGHFRPGLNGPQRAKTPGSRTAVRTR